MLSSDRKGIKCVGGKHTCTGNVSELWQHAAPESIAIIQRLQQGTPETERRSPLLQVKDTTQTQV